MKITYGNSTVNLYQRADGRWSINWTIAGKPKSSTYKGNEEGAKAKALSIAKDANLTQGGIIITNEESEYLKRMQAIATRLNRTPHQLLDQIEEDNPHQGNELFFTIYKNMEQQYMHDFSKSPETWESLNDEFKAFNLKYPDIMLRDIDSTILKTWCVRIQKGRLAEQTFNNRITIWRTFFNKARERKEYCLAKSPADEIEKKKIPSKIPPVFTISQLHACLRCLKKNLHKHNRVNHLTAFAIAVWAGLRPSEIQRLKWENIDLKNNYIHADHEVCRKLRHERYIPIHPCLNYILSQLKPTDPREINVPLITRNGWRTMIHRLKADGAISKWPEDVTRHSYISYRVAVTKNIALVADECGNSESIIKDKYRKPITPKDGRKWFTRYPSSKLKLI